MVGTKRLHGVWGDAASNMFAVGEGGTILHHAGQWTSMSSGTQAHLYAAWGGSLAVRAFGAKGTILRRAGNQWLPEKSGTTKALVDAWGAESSEVYAVGDSGTMLSKKGSAPWKPVPTGSTADLASVWGTSSSDVYVGSMAGDVLHYNGAKWTALSDQVATASSVRGIWGSGPTDLFAVGDDGMVIHFNGKTWTQMSTGTKAHLAHIWGNGPSEVYIIAPDGSLLSSDGTKWTSSKFCKYPGSGPVSGLWGFQSKGGGTHLYTLNDQYLVQLKPQTKTCGKGVALASGPARFHHLWASGPTDIHAVGEYNYGSNLAAHYDGTKATTKKWSGAPWPGGLTRVWGDGQGMVMALDGQWLWGLSAGKWFKGWGCYGRCYGLGGTGPKDWSMVGKGGTEYHYDGKTISGRALLGHSPNVSFYCVWGSPWGDTYVGGESGIVLVQ